MKSLLRRLGSLFANLTLLLFCTLTVLFFLVRLTGDPATILSGESADPAVLSSIRENLGLDRPLWVQYGIFWQNALQLDLGVSWVSGQDALTLALERLGPTVTLGLAGLLLNIAIAVPLGAFLGATHDARGALALAHRSVNSIVVVAQGVPGYVVALILIQWLAVDLRLFPSTGNVGTGSWVLPALTIAAFLAPKLTKVIAVNVADALQEDYAMIARSQGARESTVVLRHALPNAVLGATALVGTQLAGLVNGIIITETIFGWPGVGRLLLDSVLLLDFPVVQAVVLVTTVLVYLANWSADRAIEIIDPRLAER
jgi:peptide/nickel transport system permease protein